MHNRVLKVALFSTISLNAPKLVWVFQWILPSCSFSVVPTFLIFLGDFIKRGKMVRKPRMSTNLWQLCVPSGPIMAWSSTFRALLLEIFFSLGTKEVSYKAFHTDVLVLKKKKKVFLLQYSLSWGKDKEKNNLNVHQ